MIPWQFTIYFLHSSALATYRCQRRRYCFHCIDMPLSHAIVRHFVSQHLRRRIRLLRAEWRTFEFAPRLICTRELLPSSSPPCPRPLRANTIQQRPNPHLCEVLQNPSRHRSRIYRRFRRSLLRLMFRHRLRRHAGHYCSEYVVSEQCGCENHFKVDFSISMEECQRMTLPKIHEMQYFASEFRFFIYN